MINKEKIRFDESIYWVPGYTGPRKIMILEEFKEGLYSVQSGEHKFIANIEYIFNKPEHAQEAFRDWESYESKRKAAEKGRLSQRERHAQKLKNKHCRRVGETIVQLKEKGINGCFIRVTQGSEYSDKKGILLEQGFNDDVWFEFADDGNVRILDSGDNMFLIDISSVMTACKIQENQSSLIKGKWWFSYTDRTNNRTWIYFDYKEQGE